METSYGWLVAIFTIWSIYAIWKYKGEMFEKWQKILFPLFFGEVYCFFINDSLIGFISTKWILAEIMGFVIILMLDMNYKKNISAILLMCVMLFSGQLLIRSGVVFHLLRIIQSANLCRLHLKMIRMHPG